MKPLLDRGGSGPEDEDDDFRPGARRSAQAVARRCLVLGCVAASLEFSPGYFSDWLRDEGLWEELSPREVALLTAEEPSRRQKIDAAWRSESLQVMLWALGKIAEMCPLTKQVAPRNLLKVMPEAESDTRAFVAASRLRPDAVIDAELERMVNAHWQLRNEQAYPDEKAEPMIAGVVMERHHALEWMVNFNDEPWDEVSTNT